MLVNSHKKTLKGQKTASERRAERIRDILYLVCTSEVPLSSTQIYNTMRQQFGYNRARIFEAIGKLSARSDLHSYSDHKYQYPTPTRFLNFTSKQKTNEDALKAKRNFEIARIECEHAKKDYDHGKITRQELELKEKNLTEKEKYYFRKLRRDYRYYPNLRTLLLYFYHEYHAKTTRTKKVDRIRKVLSNPKIIRIAPFLEYWDDFQKYGFNVFDIFSDLLMGICEELRNQLYIKAENDTYLIRRVTERIFSEVELNLGFILDPPGDFFFIKKEGMNKYNKLAETRKKYRKLIISIQRGWLEEKRKYLDFYEQEYIM